jgi:hypothetical protein
MGTTVASAIAAVCGSLVGAAATIVTTWISLRTRRVHTEREARPRDHQGLYVEFITEASLHFTPTSGSWLNLVERFFAEIADKRIGRGAFRSEVTPDSNSERTTGFSSATSARGADR